MRPETIDLPPESVRCQRGDYILQRGAAGRIRVYRVEDLVKLSRLLPFGEDSVIEEAAILDSERPAYLHDIHLLVTGFEGDFASPEEAVQAIETNRLVSAPEPYCVNLRRFTVPGARVTRIEQPSTPGSGHPR